MNRITKNPHPYLLYFWFIKKHIRHVIVRMPEIKKFQIFTHGIIDRFSDEIAREWSRICENKLMSGNILNEYDYENILKNIILSFMDKFVEYKEKLIEKEKRRLQREEDKKPIEIRILEEESMDELWRIKEKMRKKSFSY